LDPIDAFENFEPTGDDVAEFPQLPLPHQLVHRVALGEVDAKAGRGRGFKNDLSLGL
jgi:hypothetical protein